MSDYDSIRYEKNFLTQVIVRIDFLQFLPTIQLLTPSIETEILKSFPRRGKDQKIQFNAINVTIDSSRLNTPDAQHEMIEGIQREYISGKNKLLLSNKFVVFEINDYESYDLHRESFRDVLHSLFAENELASARVGIRYINIFNSNDIKIRKNMFASSISSSIGANTLDKEGDIRLTRAMGMNEYQVSSMILNFRYGMYNPDFPNPLQKKDFVLDFDCFTMEPIESSDGILRCIDMGHKSIQVLFETSITDSLRKVLHDG